MVRACLTAAPRACRVAAHRVYRVTPAACGGGVAEAVKDGTSGSQADGELNGMDFAWSDQQRELLDAVGRFASQQLN